MMPQRRTHRPFRRRAMPLLAAVAMVASLSGCTYEQVHIVSGREYYRATILSDWRLVDADNDRITLRPGARLALRALNRTQTLAQIDVRIVDGEGLTTYVRTTPNDGTQDAMALYYRTSGCAVRTDDGDVVPIRHNAEAGEQVLRFYNEGELTWMAIGCDRVYEQTTERPATEFVIIEALPGSTVEIVGVRFDDTDVR